MSLPSLDCDFYSELCCDQCHCQKFQTHYEYKLHALAHRKEPTVTLVRLSNYTLSKLRNQSYKVNRGVAKRKVITNHVSPLKISLKKQQGTTKFCVIKKQKNSEKLKSTNECLFKEDSKGNNDEGLKTSVDVKREREEVEGNSLLERFGANISISRKSISAAVSQNVDPAENGFDEPGEKTGDSSLEQEDQEKILERLTSGGISVAKPRMVLSNSDCSQEEEPKLPTIVNVFSKANQDDLNHLKSSPDRDDPQDSENCKSSILKKLSGLGFSLVPKSSNRLESDHQPSEGNDCAEKENKHQQQQMIHKDSDLEIFLHSKNGLDNVSNGEGSSNFAYELDRCAARPGVRTPVDGSSEDNNFNFSGNGMQVPKKHVRVKNSKLKKSLDGERKDELSEKPRGVPETAVDVLERVAENLSKSAALNPDSKGSDCMSPALSLSESQFSSSEDVARQDQPDCNVLLGSGNGGENGDGSNFNSVACEDGYQSEHYPEGNNNSEEHGDEVAVAFSSLPNEDQSSLEQPQQDPLMTGESAASNGESLNQNFLHNFLDEPQAPQTNIQPEGSEYMSLERLGQGLDSQHAGSNYDLNSGDPSTPMEQLSQQVQRLPNPPQINVIPQHHMQVPQPPQLHSGLPPLSPQQPGSFDTLSHIQPPMPPPLYQGYNMYNQNYSSQAQQLPPRPPLLQQRPQIQARPFQSIAAPPRQRNRTSYPMKRNSVRMQGPQEVPTKQRRVEPSMPARSQPTNLNPATKIPSGITVTPTKKNLEASKVADVLASRGITVTPSPSAVRQPSPANRSQPRPSPAPQPPVLNIGPAVSITTNNGNRSSGGFAVPNPRRNSPIVNHNVERPERCTTVDLTQDDDPPSARNRIPGGRYPCNQCTKVFTTNVALENHKSCHRTASTLPFKCDKCSAQYPSASGLQQHKMVFHKTKQQAPDLAIPIVDLNHPGARDQLAKCGIHGFLPLSQLRSNSLGYFGVPIIHLDTAKEKAVSNLNSLGAANILVLGKMKTLSQPQIR